jgi:hypothetical protein
MAESVARIVLWLFVINLGIAFGAGLYEGRIVVPQWLSATPDSGYRWNAGVATWSSQLVAWRSGSCSRGSNHDLRILHSDNARTNGERLGPTIGGCGQGNAMGKSGLRAPRRYPDRLVGSVEGAQ